MQAFMLKLLFLNKTKNGPYLCSATFPLTDIAKWLNCVSKLIQ